MSHQRPMLHAGPIADAGSGARPSRVPYLSIALLLIPFIQLGLSFYLSVAIVVLLISVWLARRVIARGLRQSLWILFLLPVFFIPLVYSSYSELAQNALRPAREFLILSLSVCAFTGAVGVRSDRLLARCSWIIAGIVVGLTLLLILQTRSIGQFSLLQLPKEWFVMNSGTIADDSVLRYGALRPTGTYGEPSYLGFVLLSFITVLSPILVKSRVAQVTVLLALSAGLLAQSLAFLLSAGIVLGVLMTKRSRSMREKNFRTLIIIVGLVVLVIGAQLGGLVDRLQQAGAGNFDASTAVRVIVPLQVLPSFLIDFPFGLPIPNLLPEMNYYALVYGFTGGNALDNGLSNQLFQYGWLGSLIIFAFVYSTRDSILGAYALCCMAFNGAFLSFDKCALFIIVAVIFNMAKSAANADAKKIAVAAPRPNVAARRLVHPQLS